MNFKLIFIKIKNIFFQNYFWIFGLVFFLILVGYLYLLQLVENIANNNLELGFFSWQLLKIYAFIILFLAPISLMIFIAVKLANFKKYFIVAAFPINVIVIFLFIFLFEKINPFKNNLNYFSYQFYILADYLVMIIAPVIALFILFRRSRRGIINTGEERLNIKEILIKICSIIIGGAGGLFIGTISGIIIYAFVSGVVLNHDISGEESLGVALGGFLFGAPAGIIGGAMLAHDKRENKWWRIFLLLILMAIVLIRFSSMLISPLGEIMKFFN